MVVVVVVRPLFRGHVVVLVGSEFGDWFGILGNSWIIIIMVMLKGKKKVRNLKCRLDFCSLLLGGVRLVGRAGGREYSCKLKN